MEIVTYRVVTNGIDKPYVEIPEGVTHIGDDAFNQCHTLQHVKLPSSLEEIGNNAFLACKELLSVDFSKCRDLRYVGTNAFAECFALRHVNLSNCVNLRKFKDYAFDECVHLTLHIPRTNPIFGEMVCGRVQLVAMSTLEKYTGNRGDWYDVLKTAEYLLLPSSKKSELETLNGTVTLKHTPFWVEDYDKYADVFDAMGQLNVLWVESLRRQSKIRGTNGWSRAVIVGESETKNRVIDLWDRVKLYNVSNGSNTLFEISSDKLLSQGRRLVAMRSYQRQPEETKLFKDILDSYGIQEPARAPSVDVRSSKRARRLMANLRL